jgi:preprotein translocase subunit SecG
MGIEVVILVIHVFVALAIIGVVLIQPPESSAMGGLGGSNPMAGMGVRGSGNILTRATAILATIFIITSLTLAILAGHRPKEESILDLANTPAVPSPVSKPEKEKAPKEAAKAAEAPSVPLSK